MKLHNKLSIKLIITAARGGERSKLLDYNKSHKEFQCEISSSKFKIAQRLRTWKF